MRGHYKVFSGGKLVAEADNLITTQGKQIILQYLAAINTSWGDYIACGTSAVAPTLADVSLGLEFVRGPVVVKSVNYSNNTVTLKADISDELAGWVYELGVFPATTATSDAAQGQILVGFDPNINVFSVGTYNVTNYRLGAESLELTAATSATTTTNDSTVVADLSSYSNYDNFALGYFINDANTASITVRFKSDSSNYFSYTFAPGTTTGYRVTNFTKPNFGSTGAPTWDNINQVEFVVVAGSGGGTAVQLDALTVIDLDTSNSFALVSRAIPGTPYYKDVNEELNVEYTVSFSI